MRRFDASLPVIVEHPFSAPGTRPRRARRAWNRVFQRRRGAYGVRRSALKFANLLANKNIKLVVYRTVASWYPIVRRKVNE